VGIQEDLQYRRLGRRRLLGLAGGTVAAAALGPWGPTGTSIARARALPNLNQAAGFGTLVPDPKGRLALPPGFQYRELSPEGSKLTNGDIVPSWHDGSFALRVPTARRFWFATAKSPTSPTISLRSTACRGKIPTLWTCSAARPRSSSDKIELSCKASSPLRAPFPTAPAARHPEKLGSPAKKQPPRV
jgi:hypothetical protein